MIELSTGAFAAGIGAGSLAGLVVGHNSAERFAGNDGLGRRRRIE
jgi:hypothetical protein